MLLHAGGHFDSLGLAGATQPVADVASLLERLASDAQGDVSALIGCALQRLAVLEERRLRLLFTCPIYKSDDDLSSTGEEVNNGAEALLEATHAELARVCDALCKLGQVILQYYCCLVHRAHFSNFFKARPVLKRKYVISLP